MRLECKYPRYAWDPFMISQKEENHVCARGRKHYHYWYMVLVCLVFLWVEPRSIVNWFIYFKNKLTTSKLNRLPYHTLGVRVDCSSRLSCKWCKRWRCSTYTNDVFFPYESLSSRASKTNLFARNCHKCNVASAFNLGRRNDCRQVESGYKIQQA